MPLQRLRSDLVAKIAAGEVIERPASVVKELVENSIDAGATSIQIEIEEGGKKGILVVDNGCGMTPEEAPLALERHATSKIATEEDLFQIRTLGFRGEALPSIAAVSWMTLESRGAIHGAPAEGVRIEIEGGKITKQGLSSLPGGTRVSVRNLFFNTPARLKFLKSKETEFSHMAQLVETLGLAHHEIAFTLAHQGKKELMLAAATSPERRIRDLLGGEIASFLLSFQGGRSGFELFGFCSEPSVTSTTTKGLSLFVNGRAVRDRLLQHASLSAYENLLMRGRYPWVILYLKVPPALVDVNVHPTKNEVRFAQGQVVHELVRETIREALRQLRQEGGRGVAAGSEDLSDAAKWFSRLPSGGGGGGGRSPGAPRPEASESIWRGVPQEPEATPLPPSCLFSNLRVVGQVHDTYLLCETAEKLILIDQHAAHERIGFEKLKRQYETEGIARQPLLIPQNFDLTPSETEILKKFLPDLAKFGLEVEFFGGHTFILRAVPALLTGSDWVVLLRDLIGELQAYEKLSPLEEKVHEVLERMACHRQVRAGDRLTLPEIESLLSQMEETHFSYSCPHGRPAILQIPFGEIEKWFKRKL